MKSYCPNCNTQPITYWQKLFTTKVRPIICDNCRATVHLKYDFLCYSIYLLLVAAFMYLTMREFFELDDMKYYVAMLFGGLLIAELGRAIYAPLTASYESGYTIFSRVVLAILLISAFWIKVYYEISA